MSNYRSENKAISEWRKYNAKKKENKTGQNLLKLFKGYNALNKTYKGMKASAYGNEFAKFYANPSNHATMSKTMQGLYSPERLAGIANNPGVTISESFGIKDLGSLLKNTISPTEAYQSASQLGKTAKLLNEGYFMTGVQSGAMPATAGVTGSQVATGTGANVVASGNAVTTGNAVASGGGGAVASAPPVVAGGTATSTASTAGTTAGAGASGSASGGMMQAMMTNPITAVLALALIGGIGAGKKGTTLQRWFNPRGGVK